MLENILNSPFLTSLALTLLHFLWQGLLVATVLKSALLIFNNSKPQIRYALSALAMLVNLLLPVITFIIIYRTEISSANVIANSLPFSELIAELKKPDAFFSYQQLAQSLPVLLPYIAILWLATITLLAGKLLIEISTVNHLPKHGVISPSHKLQARFEVLVQQINLKITPQLLISLKVDVPMAIGWLKPVVLLPAKMISGLNNDQLEMLILHELAHIRRHDYLVNFLQTLVEILLFFHPAVLWVSKQMRNEREYCSDDIAVQHCGNAIAYAHTLADTASLCTKVHNHTIPDMAMAASGGDLKQRVIRLVDHHCAPQNNISKWFASAVIVFSVLLLSSKQLLTIPLLDIWYNESPWKEPTNDINNISNSAKTNQLANTSITVNNTPEVSAFVEHKVAADIPTSSIAKQLLNSEEKNIQKSISEQPISEKKPELTQKVLTTKIPVINDTSQLVEADSTIKAKSVAKLTTQEEVFTKTASEVIENEDDQFTAKLNNLSKEAPIKTEKNITNTFNTSSLMVEEAFERTNSNNPYKQELAQLSAPNDHNEPTKLEESFNLEHNNQTSTLLEENFLDEPDTMTTNEGQNKQLNNILLPKEKTVIAPTPTWTNAEQLTSVDPVYPSAAKRKGIEIEVKVDFTIDVNGNIKDITFDNKNKINYFKSSIRSAIKQWRFLPAKVDDHPVESQMTKVFSFSLHS